MCYILYLDIFILMKEKHQQTHIRSPHYSHPTAGGNGTILADVSRDMAKLCIRNTLLRYKKSDAICSIKYRNKINIIHLI